MGWKTSRALRHLTWPPPVTCISLFSRPPPRLFPLVARLSRRDPSSSRNGGRREIVEGGGAGISAERALAYITSPPPPFPRRAQAGCWFSLPPVHSTAGSSARWLVLVAAGARLSSGSFRLREQKVGWAGGALYPFLAAGSGWGSLWLRLGVEEPLALAPAPRGSAPSLAPFPARIPLSTNETACLPPPSLLQHPVRPAGYLTQIDSRQSLLRCIATAAPILCTELGGSPIEVTGPYFLVNPRKIGAHVALSLILAPTPTPGRVVL